MADTLERLYATLLARKTSDGEASYTKSLFDKGIEKCAEKLGEEAIETVIAAVKQDDKALIGESADLLYHLLVVLAARDIPLDAVLAELERRMGTSGHAEKASRSQDS